MFAASREAGVSHFMVPATDAASLDATVEIANRHENIYCALGIHPHSASEWNSDLRKRIHDLHVSNDKVRAVGEIGLDYHYDLSPRDSQRRAFEEQIELALELHKPIVIHTRESEEDVFRIIEQHYSSLLPEEHPGGQFHCFSLGHEFLQRALSLGFHISYTGNITFKNSNLAAVVEDTPLDRILIETDSPYLSPVPQRGRRNTPAFLPFIAQKAAEIKNLDRSIVMQHTFANALRLFRIAVPLILLFCALGFSAASVHAQVRQPAGIQPPDSVLTGNRRQAEELRKKQQEELAREAEQHRLDSIKAEQNSLEAAQAKAREQVRQDSIRSAREAVAEEQHAAFLLTPQPWRAIGFGANAGVGSMHMTLDKPSLTPTSVFAYGFQLNTAVTRRLDISANFSHFQIGDSFPNDSVYNYGLGRSAAFTYTSDKFYAPETRLVRSETLTASVVGVDVHYVITRPTAVVAFYFGIGYQHLMMASKQHFFHMASALTPLGGNNAPVDSLYEQDWSRNGLDLLFGMKHDFEVGNGLTLEPFIEIAGTGVFNGPTQDPSFVFQPDQTALITVNFRAGVTLYYGWWGVPRQE